MGDIVPRHLPGRRRTDEAQGLMGSSAQRVLPDADRPVLAVKP